MCGLCGLLGVEHWTDMSASPEAFAGQPRTRRHERMHRARLANRVLAHYRLKLADWQGRSFVLTGPTGKHRLVDDLAALWPAAEAMAGRRPDPLDPELLARLERAVGW